MTAEQIKSLRLSLLMDLPQIGQFLKIPWRTFYQWETGRRVPGAAALAVLANLEDKLEELRQQARKTRRPVLLDSYRFRAGNSHTMTIRCIWIEPDGRVRRTEVDEVDEEE